MASSLIPEINPKDILESWFGTPVKWIAGFGSAAAILKFTGLDKKMGFDIGALFEKGQDFLTGAWENLTAWISGKFDPESTTMNKAVADRINDDKGFAIAERVTGIAGIGKELRDLTLEAAKEGGDPIGVGRALHKKIVSHIIGKWQDANPEGTPPESLTEKAEKIATGITGIVDQEAQPRVVRKGVVGLLMQAKEAKDKESTLTEGEVKAINLSPELQALADAAAAPITRPSASGTTPPPTTPPKDPKVAASGRG